MIGVLIALTAGAAFGAALWLVWVSLQGHQVLPDPRRWVPSSVRPERATVLLIAAAIAGLLVASISGWPVAGLGTAVVVLYAPTLLGVKAERQSEIDQAKAIASWTEMTRDTVAAGRGLEEALMLASAVSATVIQPEMRSFLRRAQHRDIETALEGLADDLAHPAADFVIAALLNAARNNARDMAALLARLSVAIREDVDMRVEVNARRAGIRTEAKSVIVVVLVTVVGTTLYANEFVAAYNTVTGQIVMALILVLFAGGTFALLRLARFAAPDRFEARRTTPVDILSGEVAQ